MGIFSIRRLAVVGAATSAVLLVPTSTMAQAVAAGVLVGQGTIIPAPTIVTQPDSGGFTGTIAGGAVMVPPAAGTATCSFTFTGNDNVAQGGGSASGNCSGTAGSLDATLSYTRVGPVMVLTGSGSINGQAVTVYAAACLFVPTSAPNVASYLVACAVGGAGA